jgi:DNA-binding winged helix-turn-helix (wHTH) protein
LSAPTPSPLLRFGAFEVNLEHGELRRSGYRIKLQEKPFHVLAVLLERPGALLTREELHQRLWNGNTFVDFDHNLNNAVNKLREALNDSCEKPRFIETIPRRGYRFIADVEVAHNGNGKTRMAELPARQIKPPVEEPRDAVSGVEAPVSVHAPPHPKRLPSNEQNHGVF